MGGYEFLFHGVKTVQGPNYTAHQGHLTASRDGQLIAEMRPEKRTYLVQKMPMTEAAIDPGLTRDLFVALGEDLGQNAWSLRVYHKPFIRWIWLGAVIMALGALVGASERRYRVLAKRSQRVDAQGAKVSGAVN